jgi:hypothetical protein
MMGEIQELAELKVCPFMSRRGDHENCIGNQCEVWNPKGGHCSLKSFRNPFLW